MTDELPREDPLPAHQEPQRREAYPARTHCALCGLPVGRSTHSLDRNGRTVAFCCPGCRAVYEILSNTPGLSTDDFSLSPIFQAARDAGLIPRGPEAPPSYCAPGPETDGEELTFELRGMWCPACAWLIENVLLKHQGVLSARVHFLSDAATVRYVPHRIHPERILEIVSRLGYGANLVPEGSPRDPDDGALLTRLGVASILALNAMMLSWALYTGFFHDLGDGIQILSYPLWALSTVSVFYSGWPILRRAAVTLIHGGGSMETLIATGCLSAYGYSTVQMIRGTLHVYFDTATMLVALVLFGKVMEARARDRVAGGLNGLQRLSGGKARVAGPDRACWVPLHEVKEGDICQVMEGERVPVDGLVVDGEGSVDESPFTGESYPKARRRGDRILAGTQLLWGSLRIRVERVGQNTTLQQMLRIMNEALMRKNPSEILADRITRWMVPGILGLALTTGVWLLIGGSPGDEAVLRSLTVLLITCPCALGIATPLAKVAAMWAARSFGVIVRDGSAIEKLSRVDTLLLDKTGTVTEGKFELRNLVVLGLEEKEALRLLGALEAHSSHVLAREILRLCDRAGVTIAPVSDFHAADGMGLGGRIDGQMVLAGSPRWMRLQGAQVPEPIQSALDAVLRDGLTVVLLARAGAVCGLFAFGDAIRADAHDLQGYLRTLGIQTHLVSGDSSSATARVAGILGCDGWTAEALPGDKLARVESLQATGQRVAMLGDGVNDGVAMAAADVGVALGDAADLLHEASSMIILSGGLGSVCKLIELCRLSTRIIKQNLFAAFLYNLLAVPLAMAGYLNPLIAVVSMVASSLTVIANTLRIRRAFP